MDPFKPGDSVRVFFKTSKQNEKVCSIQARVVEEPPQVLKCRSEKWQERRILYEHVRISPTVDMENGLFEKLLEDELYSE